MTPADREHYKTTGYVVLRGVVDPDNLDALEYTFTHFAEKEHVGVRMHSALYAQRLADLPRDAQARLYDSMRAAPSLAKFANGLSSIACALLDRNIAVRAPRFRMDQPRDLRYLAVWHQDHHYVGGSVDTVTAWVPLQDTPWEMGPLLIVPGSHYLALKHIDGPMGRKVAWPLANTREQIIGMPMRRGDVLLFHSLLLHSGQPNLSDRVRYSIQIRYEPL